MCKDDHSGSGMGYMATKQDCVCSSFCVVWEGGTPEEVYPSAPPHSAEVHDAWLLKNTYTNGRDNKIDGMVINLMLYIAKSINFTCSSYQKLFPDLSQGKGS